ncbi:MAG: DNA repair protein RecO [Cyclobacteriaceae bacterium]|nr:DNA repair protein RecO [Cyclobacteriaceae bacterium]
MIHKTRGIVFRFTKYGDTSIIVNIFTELFGLQSYIVNNVRSKSSRTISLYQPLTLLDLVVYHRENGNIMRIKEARCLHAYQSIHQDIRKTTIALFLAEMLNKSVKDQSNAESIYDFFMNSFIALDKLEGVENFHLVFLVKLSRHLGFGPQATHEILEGHGVTSAEEAALHQLLTAEFEQCPALTHEVRRSVLELLLTFYKRHLEMIGEIRSVAVLQEVFTH